MDIFLDCLFDKEYNRLVISGEADEAQCIQAWNKIYAQSHELSGNANNPIVEKIKHIEVLAAKITLCEGILVYLQLNGYDKDLVEVLFRNGISIGMEPGGDMKMIKAAVGMLKRWAIDKDIAEKEIQALCDSNNKSVTREYYEDWLDGLSQMRKYTVRAQDISVMQFYRAIDQVKKQQSKHAKR